MVTYGEVYEKLSAFSKLKLPFLRHFLLLYFQLMLVMVPKSTSLGHVSIGLSPSACSPFC